MLPRVCIRPVASMKGDLGASAIETLGVPILCSLARFGGAPVSCASPVEAFGSATGLFHFDSKLFLVESREDA